MKRRGAEPEPRPDGQFARMLAAVKGHPTNLHEAIDMMSTNFNPVQLESMLGMLNDTQTLAYLVRIEYATGILGQNETPLKHHFRTEHQIDVPSDMAMLILMGVQARVRGVAINVARSAEIIRQNRLDDDGLSGVFDRP